MTTSTNNAGRIREIYDAFAAGDIPTVLGSFHEDIVWNEAENFIYADGNPYKGADAILNGLFMRLGGEWDGFRLTGIQVFNVEGDRALATGRYQGIYKATGKPINAQFAHFWKFRDGQIISFQQYTDTMQVAEAVKATKKVAH